MGGFQVVQGAAPQNNAFQGGVQNGQGRGAAPAGLN